MSNCEDILESYWECKFQVDQVFSKELEEPIVIHSRVPNELPSHDSLDCFSSESPSWCSS